MRGIKSKEDARNLQTDLDKIYKWSQQTNMSLNDDKFEGLQYGQNNKLKNDIIYKTPTGRQIAMKDDLLDLGIVMSNDC